MPDRSSPTLPAARRRVQLIGIGVGAPELLTVQAARAIAATDVFVVLDKGEDLDDLADLRRRILAEHAGAGHRVVELADPPRDLGGGPYDAAVAAWHVQRAELLAEALTTELGGRGTAALLVWGDPSLYDSTLRVLDDVADRLPWPVEVEVVPGISSLHLLTARHRIPLNRIGASVRITTGRRLAAAPPDADFDVVVFLDGRCAFTALDPTDVHIYWGAFLGTPDELLVSGPLGEVSDRIVAARSEARARKGWMFDTYLLRWTG